MALTDPNNQRTVMRYDQNGRLFLKYSSTNSTQAGSSLGATPVVMTVNNLTRYQYNDNDQLVKVISGIDNGANFDANSSQEIYELSYDDLGRLLQKRMLLQKGSLQEEQDLVSYEYENQLYPVQVKSIQNKSALLTFKNESRPPFQKLEFAQRKSINNPSLPILESSWSVTPGLVNPFASLREASGGYVIQNSFDPAGRLLGSQAKVLDRRRVAQELAFQFQHDAFGRMGLSQSPGFEQRYQYNLQNQVTGIQSPGARDLAQQLISYNENGLIESIHQNSFERTFAYDTKNQLVQVEASGRLSPHLAIEELAGLAPRAHNSAPESFTREFTFDANGNRLNDSIQGEAQYLNDQIVQSKNSYLEQKFVSDEDGQGRLIRKFSSSKEDNFTYRIDGKLSQYSSKNTELQNKLDQMNSNGTSSGRISELSLRGFNEVQLLKTDVQYHYDGLGRRILKQVSNTLVLPISERCEEKCDKKGKIHPQYLKQCTPKTKVVSFYQKFNYFSDQEQILLSQNGEQKTTLILDKYDSSNPNDHLGELSKEHKLAYVKDHLGSIMNSYANFDPELDDSKHGNGDHHQKHRERNRKWDTHEKSRYSHDDRDDDDDDSSLTNLSNLDSNGYDLDLAEYIKSRNNNSKMQQHRLYGTNGESTPLTLAPNSPAVTYGYTGAEYDLESNTYYLRARNYDPATARFLIKDPIGFNGGDTNSYRYVGNNPVNKLDPMGTTEEDVRRAVEIVTPYVDLSQTRIIYKDMGRSDVGMGYPATLFTPPTLYLHTDYLQNLDAGQRTQLLNTVYHEGTHTQETWSSIIADSFRPIDPSTGLTQRHLNIYNQSDAFSDAYGSRMNDRGVVRACPGN